MTNTMEQQLREDYVRDDYCIATAEDICDYWIARMREHEAEVVRKCAEIARNEKVENASSQDEAYNTACEDIALQIESLLGKE